MNIITIDKIVADLATKDSFFAANSSAEKLKLRESFEYAVEVSCPHIVTILHRTGNDSDFNAQVKKAMRETMSLPKDPCLVSMVLKHDLRQCAVDWPESRVQYAFRNPAAAEAFARAAERDYGVTTASHSIVEADFTPHTRGPRP